MKKAITLILLASMLLSTIACGSEGGNNEVTTNGDETTDSNIETEFVYEYKKTYDGDEVTILNAGDVYNMRAELDREEITGEALDDAMYNRCRKVEKELGVTIVESTAHVDDKLAQQQQQSIMSGEDEYNIMYIPARDLYKFTDGGYLNDLTMIDEIQLDQPWWNSSYNNSCMVNGELYSAIGASQLMYIDSLWCLFFNETMMADLKLEKPYDYVRNGTWTIDKFVEYQIAGAQLNSDDSFDWNENGTCIYGYSGGSGEKFLTASGEFIITLNKNQEIELDVGDGHFYDVCDKLSKVLVINGGNRIGGISGVADGMPGNYVTIFETQRSLFLGAEVCKTTRMRDKEFEFGIVPFPKYDEDQEAYYSNPFYATPGFAIPVTCQDVEQAALVGDALSYLGYEMVLPTFIETTLKGKGLRNDDSIEMLNIIMNSARADLCQIYATSANKMRSAIQSAITNGEGVASAIAANESAVKEAIDKANGKS